MSQNICNICGANYEYRNSRWVCPGCGAYKEEELSNEEVTLLYNAAQKLRFADFDEAEKAYTDIIEKYPQNHNGYWGRLLSKYGIKYEDDFDGRKIPTCYATSIASVITDKDYLKAIELADADTKAYYQNQAEYIERVRKEWVSKASKEKPYDIFLCYKDSDLTNGVDRTKDSVAVQELYIHLTNLGYRVFYSRESLRDKVGEKYEPYIFNALSTAKVMLVYGSSSDYITSTWLKNEWTRYEKRLRTGEKKPNSLLVACDGFYPSELPKTLSSMQCFDATKPSFYSDLDAVVKKIIKGEEKPKPEALAQPQNKSKKAHIAIAVVTVVIAVILCILIPNLLNKDGVTSLTNSQYNASISISDGEFPSDTIFKIEKHTASKELASTLENLPINQTNYHVYDMSLYSGNSKVNVNGKVVVAMPLPDDILPNKAVVYYVSGSTSEKISSSVMGGEISFTTTHFSIYVIAEKAEAQTSPDDNQTGNNGGNTGDNNEQKPDDNQGGTTPGTGDNTGNSSNNQGGGNEDNPTPPKTVNITFNANGGSGTMSYQTVTVGVKSILNECTFTRDGYMFAGWATSAGGTTEYTDGASITVNTENAVSLYAIWVPNSNSLIFNANGGSGYMDSVSIETNQTIALPTNAFTKSGYTFAGWSDVQGGDVKYTNSGSFKMTSSASVTLYAVWTANTNSVVLKANNGTNNETTVNIKTDETKNLPTNSFTKVGYTFVGWSSSSNGLVEYTDGASYTMGDSSVTLYAVWEANNNSIIFNANGGSGTMSAQQAKTNESVNLNQNTFTREGYTFAGWATSSTGNAAYADQAAYIVGIEAEYTLYAVWIKVAYTITYHMNGGSNNVNNPYGYDVTDSTITLANPERDGYTFLGWFSEAIFQNKVTSIPTGSTGNKAFYASWSANTNSINFNANGGSGNMSAQQAKTDEAINLTQNAFTRGGYMFVGWATSASGYVVYNDKSNYTMGASASVTLYAVWTPISYSITYDLQGGTISGNKSSYDATTNSFTLPTPTKTGYSFAGWSGTDITGTQMTVTVTKGSIGNRIYTANWTADEYTVTLNANGGTVSTTTIKIKYNENIEYPTPVKTGYTFAGWFNGNTEYSNGKWTYTNGVSLKAKWTANTNIITFNANGGSGTMPAQQVKTGETVTLNQNAFIRTGYTFAGWSTSSTGNVVYTNRASYTVGTDSNYTLYAIWTTVVYKITYNLNGGTNHIDNPSSYTVESENISLATPTRKGYVFKGWFEDYSYTKEITNINVSVAKNITLYAKWEEYPFVYTIDSGEVTITDCKSKGDIIIPSEIEGYPVTKIGEAAFKYDDITNVVIPEGVVSIEKEAFHYCDLLTTVDLPSTLVTIGDSAFYECVKLTDVILPDGLTKIGADAFNGCDGLTSVSIPNVVVSIEDSTFWHCGNLKTVTIPNSVTSIGSCAFCGCSSLTEITIPDSVESLGESAFDSCSNLVRVKISDTVELINDYAFQDCKKLQHLTIGSNVSVIGKYAFQNCNNLISVIIPDSVVTIDTSAFQGCRRLASIILGKNVLSIGTSAFNSCEALVEVFNLSNSLTITPGDYKNGYVAYYALDVYTSTSVDSGVTVDGEGYVFYETDKYCYLIGYIGNDTNLILPDTCNGKDYMIYKGTFKNMANIESIIVSDRVTAIEKDAFWFCSNLKSITIGSGVKSIESFVFAGCENLSSIFFKDKVGWYYSSSYSSSTKTEISESHLQSDIAAAKLVLQNYTCYWFKE